MKSIKIKHISINLHKIFMGILAVLLLATFIIGSSPPVNAADPINLDDLAKSYQAYYLIKEKCQMDGTIKDFNGQYKWFTSPSNNSQVSAGVFISSPKDMGTCDSDEVRSVYKELWGIGIQDKKTEEQVLVDDLQYKKDSNNWLVNDGGQKLELLALAEKLRPEKFTFLHDNNLKEGLLAYIFSTSFTKICAPQGLLENPTPEQKAAGDSGGQATVTDNGNKVSIAKIAIANNDGTVTDQYYAYDPGNQVSAGFGTGFPSPDSCGNLVKKQLAGNRQIVQKLADLKKNGATSDGSDQSAASNEVNCREQAGALGFILCPIADAIDGMATALEGQIYNLLRVNNIGDSDQLKYSWGVMKNMATVIIVLISLVIVASQIFNFEFLSAYTVKKALPRLVIVVVVLQVSWYLVMFLINFINALGDSLQAILLIPFPPLAALIKEGKGFGGIMALQNTGTGGVIGTSIVAILISLGVLLASGGIGVLALGMLVVAGAVLVAYVTLVLRVIFIYGLVLVMPIAIVLWILPSTKTYFDKWWGTLSKLLLMYPLVVGLLTIGKIGAYLAATADGQKGNIVQNISHFAVTSPLMLFAGNSAIVITFMIIIAYWGPFFMIPSTFKFGGTILAKASGAVNGVSSKWAHRGGEKAHSGFKDKMAEQYNKHGKAGNFLSRVGTGQLIPTTRSQAYMAQNSQKIGREKVAMNQALLQQKRESKDLNQTEYVDHLGQVLENGDEAEKQAAFNELVDNNGYKELIRNRSNMSEKEWGKLISRGDKYSKLKADNRTLTGDDRSYNIEKGSAIDLRSDQGEITKTMLRASLEGEGVDESTIQRIIHNIQVEGGSKKLSKQEIQLAINASRAVTAQQNIGKMSQEEILASHGDMYKDENIKAGGYRAVFKTSEIKEKLASIDGNELIQGRVSDNLRKRINEATSDDRSQVGVDDDPNQLTIKY